MHRDGCYYLNRDPVVYAMFDLLVDAGENIMGMPLGKPLTLLRHSVRRFSFSALHEHLPALYLCTAQHGPGFVTGQQGNGGNVEPHAEKLRSSAMPQVMPPMMLETGACFQCQCMG